MRWALVMVFLIPAAVSAQTWHEPPRGSAERAAIMDEIRPKAEYLFAPPVEFVVGALRVSGDMAFVMVGAQRPGGGAIDIQATPGWREGYFMADADWTAGQALLQRTPSGWAVVEEVFGATDVWWSGPMTCARFRPVIADACP
jgi:hypothetical protein